MCLAGYNVVLIFYVCFVEYHNFDLTMFRFVMAGIRVYMSMENSIMYKSPGEGSIIIVLINLNP